VNRLPPHPDPPDDADERYRRASALDPSRPGDAVRRTVLAHAARLAAERAHRPRAPRTIVWRPALFGTLAVAVLAGLVIAPRYLLPDAHTAAGTLASRAAPSTEMSGPAAQQAPAAPQAAPVAAPPAVRLEAGKTESRAFRHSERAGSSGPLVAREALTAERAATPPALASNPAAQPTASDAEEANSAPGAGLASADRRSELRALTPSPLSRAQTPPLAPPQGAAAADPAAAFRHAAEVGDVPALQTLLAEQSDINARDSAGCTALMLATLHGQQDAVVALLGFGADPNIADARGITPLKAARSGAREAIAQTLQRYGAR
jgi:Ankyrin repeats (many copies)